MKILFMGSVVTPDLAEKLTGTSIAGNKMQYCVVKELSHYPDIRIDAITVKSRAAFPRDLVAFEKSDIIKLFENVHGYCISYCNIPIIKQVWHTLSMYQSAKRYIKSKGTPDVLLTYNLFPQTGWGAIRLGKKYNIPVVTLLADLPIDDAAERNGLMRFWRSIFDSVTRKCIGQCDNIVALNKNAVDIYHPGANYIVIDGGIEITAINSIETARQKNIVFAGSLVKYNGIVQLVNAMKFVQDKNIVLNIYGDGDLHEFVAKSAKKESNIIYHGRVNSSSLNKIYQEAWLLINPRPVDDKIAFVTFPSKIFEYLLSGTPVLSTRLSGFSEEYNNVMFFSQKDNAESLGRAINQISDLSNDQLNELASKAQQFIINNKTWEKQCRKIKDFLEKVVAKEGRKPC